MKYRDAVAEITFWDGSGNFPAPGRKTSLVNNFFAALSDTPSGFWGCNQIVKNI